MLLVSSFGAQALDGNVALSDLHHDIWTGKDGAPAQVSSMAQTTDGWLWIGSVDGFYRFDGLRFRRFEPLTGETMAKRPVTALTALANGDLLIGYLFGGVSRLHNGHLTHYPATVDNVPIGPVSTVAADRDGVVWVANVNVLLRLRDGAWHKVGRDMGLPQARVSIVTTDQYDQLWVTVGNDLYMLPRGADQFRRVPGREGDSVNLMESPDGRLWRDLHDYLLPVPAQHDGPLKPRPAWLAQSQGQESGLFDRDGNFWALACPVGICRVERLGLGPSVETRPNSGPRSRLDQPWQMSSLTGNVLFEDRDGSIWVGTQAGVERFRQNRLRKVEMPPGARVYQLARDPDGNVLVLAKPNGHIWRLRPAGPERFGSIDLGGNYGGLGNGADGELLIAGGKALERRYRGHSERIAYPPEVLDKDGSTIVTRVFDDGEGVWIHSVRHGGYRYQQGQWRSHVALGLPAQPLLGAAGATKGSAWFGFNDGAISHFDRGRIRHYQISADNDIGAISYLRAGADGEVVAGGFAGLAVLKGDHFVRLGAVDADVLSGVSGMVIGANGDRWLNGGKGVLHIKAADWRATLAAPRLPLKYTLIGVLDGYPGYADTSSRRSSAQMDADGQIWLAGASGLVRLDTRQADRPQPPPQVRIETLVAQGRRYLDLGAPVVLPAGTTSFRIEYTALSYLRPEMVRFRYQLEGVDAGWQEAGMRRAVSYTKLGPGEYRFRVVATDDMGQANLADAADSVLTLRIVPTFVQTPLFLGMCVLATALLLYVLYLLWLKQATLRIAERMAERRRIARTLHDTFLQSVQGLVLGFQTVMNALPDDSSTRPRLERMLLLADRVMEEGRDEVLDLRSSAMSDGDLERGLAVVGEVLQESQRSVFSLRREGDVRRLRDEVGCEAYSIGREALMNAFRHAAAKSIQVTLAYGAEQFLLQVTDDGEGIAADILAQGQRPGHWGLQGMRERAERVGGKLVIDTPLIGTRVTLTLPAARAYVARRRWWRWPG